LVELNFLLLLLPPLCDSQTTFASHRLATLAPRVLYVLDIFGDTTFERVWIAQKRRADRTMVGRWMASLGRAVWTKEGIERGILLAFSRLRLRKISSIFED